MKRPRDGDKAAKSSKQRKISKQREFDFSRFRKRKIALRIAYLGFVVPEGLVQQQDDDGTVESLLLQAAIKTCLADAKADAPFGEIKTALNYSLCGRTDKGVSGLGNVVTLTVRSSAKHDEQELPAPEKELKYGLLLNRVLPPGVRVMSWAPVDDEFNARFDCQYRAYKYFFTRGDLDIEAMQEACSALKGEHDYRNFCTMDVANVTHFNRCILDVHIKPVDHTTSTDPRFQLYEFYVKGTAFLYHQVRCSVSLLFMVGQKLESPSIVRTLLDVEAVPRKPQYHIASDVPLVLYECGFCAERVPWKHDADAHKRVATHFTQLLVGQFSLQTAVVQCILGKLHSDHDGSQPIDDGEGAARHVKLMDRQKEETYEQRKANFERRQKGKESRKEAPVVAQAGN